MCFWIKAVWMGRSRTRTVAGISSWSGVKLVHLARIHGRLQWYYTLPYLHWGRDPPTGVNPCHSWCRTQRSRGGDGGLTNLCLQPRQMRMFPEINARVKGQSPTGLVVHGMSGGGTEGIALCVDTIPLLNASPAVWNKATVSMSLAATSRR